MRHFRSILYATVLAPAVWVLCGLGFTHDLTGRARDGGGVDALTALLLLLSAGAAYSILLLAPISPAGPLLGGVVFFGVAVWALLSPSTYASLWPAAATKDTLDLSLPGYGLAVLLAVPLIATALSARRWERYEPPKVPVIGTLGQSHGVARPAGLPLTLLETATMQKAAATPDTTQVVAGAHGADATIVMRATTSPAGSDSSAVSSGASAPESSVDEPVTEVVGEPADEAGDKARNQAGDQAEDEARDGTGDEVTATYAVSAAGEVTATGAVVTAAVAERAAEPAGAEPAGAEPAVAETAPVEAWAEPDTPQPDHAAGGVVVAVAPAPDVDTTEIKSLPDGASADATPQEDAPQEDAAQEAESPEAEPPEAESPQRDEAAQVESPHDEAPQLESSQDDDEPVTARVGERAADEPTVESGTGASESDEEFSANDLFAVAEAVQHGDQADEAAPTEAFAVTDRPDEADQADEPDVADDGEPTDVVPTRATAEPPIDEDEDENDKTQIIRLPIGELATHDLRNRRIPGEGPTQEVDDGGRTQVLGPGERTQVIARGPEDETQVIRLPGPRTPAADGERTQVIRLGSNTVEPPGDRTQVLKLPVADEPTADRREPPPSILNAERPNPGDDPTTRLVVPDGYDEREETTADVGPSRRRIMTVMNLERPVDEVADDTRRLVAPPPPRQRRPQDDD